MALFFPDDPSYDETTRLKGFDRYRQVLSNCAADYFKSSVATALGALPLALGITFSVLSSSILVLVPASLAGGLILGPFLAALYDSILRGLRDRPGRWFASYRKGLAQNLTDALLPGALTGLFAGMFIFMAYIMFWTDRPVPGSSLLLCLISLYLFLLVSLLVWPQLVLFRQRAADTARNAILFTARYLWRVLGAAALVLFFVLVTVLFAPWSVILVPFLGWFPLFAALFLIYDQLNESFGLEEAIERMEEEAAPHIEDPGDAEA